MSAMKLSPTLAVADVLLLAAPLLSRGQTATEKDPLDRVLAELQAGHHHKAMAALDQAIKQQPNNPDAYLLRGSLKVQVDRVAALADFNKVIELRPDSGAAYNQRALLRLMKMIGPWPTLITY